MQLVCRISAIRYLGPAPVTVHDEHHLRGALLCKRPERVRRAFSLCMHARNFAQVALFMTFARPAQALDPPAAHEQCPFSSTSRQRRLVVGL